MTLSRSAWLWPVVGALLAPMVTWLPMVAHRWPALGLPPYPLALGIDLWHAQTLWLAGLLLIASLVWSDGDRWLALGVALVAVNLFVRGVRIEASHSLYIALGALALVAVRHTPPSLTAAVNGRAWELRPQRALPHLLAAWGLFQAVYCLQQVYLQYDVLWGPLFGGRLNKTIQPLGTLGTVDAAAAYVAITAPLMPLLALPIAIVAVLTSQSLGAIAALSLGLALRFWPAWRDLLGKRARLAALSLGLVASLAMLYTIQAKGYGTSSGRFLIWHFGALDGFGAWLFGHGISSWGFRIPALQTSHHFFPTGEAWREAHNEYLQWWYETGLVGVAVAALWFRAHAKRLLTHPVYAGSVAALAVTCTTFFTFHVVSPALLGIAILGLATLHHEQEKEA